MSKEIERVMKKQELNLWLGQGWKLKEENDEQYVLVKNEQKLGVHLIIYVVMALLTQGVIADGIGLLMPFLGNIVYYFMSNKKKIVMK